MCKRYTSTDIVELILHKTKVKLLAVRISQVSQTALSNNATDTPI